MEFRRGEILTFGAVPKWTWLAAICVSLCGCAAPPVSMNQTEYLPAYEEPPPPRPAGKSKPKPEPPRPKGDLTLQQRVVTAKELSRWTETDPDLTLPACIAILSRINFKDHEYVRDDIKHGRPLRAPKDFTAYKDWTPLPRTLSGINQIPKCIVIVKDIPFLGWYERGKLTGDTYICIGRSKTWTRRGLYRIKEKDPDHMSGYPNVYGAPSSMPFALKIYERVWIHAGDIVGPNCSHGCINVPLSAMAQKLYDWSEVGTVVLVTDSLASLGTDLQNQAVNKPVRSPAKEPAARTGKKIET